MPRMSKPVQDAAFLSAALEGLELQRQRIEEQIRQVKALLGRGRGRRAAAEAPAAPARKRELSEAARKRIAAAQKRRWAEYRKKQTGKGAAAAKE